MGTSAELQVERRKQHVPSVSFDFKSLFLLPQEVRELAYKRVAEICESGSARDFARVLREVVAADRLAFEYFKLFHDANTSGIRMKLESNDPTQLDRIHAMLSAMNGETDSTLPQLESIPEPAPPPAAVPPPGNGSK